MNYLTFVEATTQLSVFCSLKDPLLSQGAEGNYGLDWDGPVPDAEADIVEVPETNCPLDNMQIGARRVLMNVTISNAVDAYFDVLHQTTGMINE